MNRVNPIASSVGPKVTTKSMTKISVLSVIALILMYIDFPVTFIAPNFIKMDISDVPALIGGFAMGPMAGVSIEGIKVVLEIIFKGTTTGGVGELSNFLVGCAFVVPASLIYHYKKSYRTAFIGLLVGIMTMTLFATISNYFFIFPLYAKFMPMETIVAAGSAITSKVTDLWTLMVYCMAPFNILKGLAASAVTMVLYKRVSPILHR